jgi:hypothetical protein
MSADGGPNETCEELCDPSKCMNPGNVCVDNHCELPCMSQLDCAQPGQNCVAATTDGADGGSINICQPNGRAPIGKPCPLGSECKGLMACPDGSNCDFTQCGGQTCTPDPLCAVDAGTPCVTGTCPDMSPCTVQGCTMDQCKPLLCLSAGAGDANAYCTMQDCQTDANCPGGFACDKVRDAHPICGAPASKLPGLCGISCTAAAACVTAYGTGSTCASSMFCEGACVMANAPGTTYAQGPYCTFRNECRMRKLCEPCTTDIDCSLVPGNHCTAIGSANFCLNACKTDADCGNGFKCNGSACVPRAGSCTGSKTFCEPCHDDTECGSGLYCSRESSGVERICVSPIGTIMCMTDADCPKSPSGLHGKCMDETVQSTPGDGIYHTCWLPYVSGSSRFECWAGNTGAGCIAPGDCINKVCIGGNTTTMQPGTCK